MFGSSFREVRCRPDTHGWLSEARWIALPGFRRIQDTMRFQLGKGFVIGFRPTTNVSDYSAIKPEAQNCQQH